MYRPIVNESVIATLYSRDKNTIDTETDKGKKFNCRIVSNFRYSDMSINSVMLGKGCRMAIYATECPYKIQERDTIVINGNKMLVDSVELDYTSMGQLTSSIYSNSYLEAVCPKVVYLK